MVFMVGNHGVFFTPPPIHDSGHEFSMVNSWMLMVIKKQSSIGNIHHGAVFFRHDMGFKIG